MNDILNASVIAAIIASCITLFGQYLINEKSKKEKIRYERLIKLLMPLYVEFKECEVYFSVETTDDNGDPAVFLSDLPNFYRHSVSVIKENLHLADNEFTQKALQFLAWSKIDAVDSSRYEKAMFGRLDDKAHHDFKNFIIKKYESERDYFLK